VKKRQTTSLAPPPKRQGGSGAGRLEAEQIRQLVHAYLDRRGWDVVEDEVAWREYQRRRLAAEYAADHW
jgi:hypothetical protein